ncbi:MAG: hypothetical protein ACK4PK_08090 [Alphaproteobacteria bacterium]
MTTSLPQNKSSAPLDSLRSDVLNVLAVLDDFSALLTAETSALKKKDFDAVDGLQAHKRDIAKRYHDMIAALAAKPDALSGVDMPLRERLVKTRIEFTRLLQENLTVLENVKKSTQRLVDRILEVARASVTEDRHHAYAPTGKAEAARSSSLSLSLDKSL